MEKKNISDPIQQSEIGKTFGKLNSTTISTTCMICNCEFLRLSALDFQYLEMSVDRQEVHVDI